MATESSMRKMRRVVIASLACLGILVAGCQLPSASDAGAAPLLNPTSAPYNAKGDGVTDDTAALQAWLNAGGVRLANGSFRIVKGLTLAGNNRRFYTENAKIVADGRDITALTVTGKNANIRAYIDGKNKAAFGLRVSGPGAVVESGRYENFRSITGSARAIEATTNGGVIVRNNVIRNVVSVGDKTIGNGPGTARAIALNSNVPAVATSFISGNRIENITGEEGDAIHVLFYDGRYPFRSGKVTISGNQIRNVSRRFIKVQASNVVVASNTLNFDLVRAPANPGPAIDVIRSEYVNVGGNHINPNLIGTGITVSGVSAVRLRGIDVHDNVLRQKATKTAVSIDLAWATSPKVLNNLIYGGGAGVLVRSSTNVLVQGNKKFPGVR